MPKSKAARQTCHNHVRNLYVRHPPSGTLSPEQLPSLYVTEFDERVPTETWLMLIGRRLAHQNGDALAPLEVFVNAHDAGLYPPFWALEALADGFRKYHNRQGKTPLDNILKLNQGSGKSWFRESAQRELRCKLTLQLYHLRTCFDVTVNDAAAMLEAKLKQNSIINNTRWNDLGVRFTEETFRRHYLKWKREFHFDERDTDHPVHPDYTKSPWSHVQRQTFLASFPRYSWPPSDKWPTRLQAFCTNRRIDPTT